MADDLRELTAAQRAALRVLARGGTHTEAAASAGVSLATLKRWRAEAGFRAAEVANRPDPARSWGAYD